MTAGAPWSVKGIDPKAREVAKDLARRSGMTLGEWLNRMILEDDAPEEATSHAEIAGRGGRAYYELPRERESAPRIEAPMHAGDEMARVAAALDRLSSHIEASEARTGMAISGVEHSVRETLARIEAAEREQVAVAARFEGAVSEVETGQARLAERLRKMEAEAVGPRSPEAVHALEASVAKVAGQLYETEARTRDMLAAVEDRVSRIETAGAAPQALVEEVVARVGDRLAEAEGQTARALEGLRDSFAALDTRMRDIEGEGFGAHESRFEQLAADLTARMDAVRQEMAERLTKTTDGRLDRMEATLGEMAQHVRTAEQRSAKAIETMGREVLNLAETLNRRVQHVEQRSADAIEQVGGEVARIGAAMETRLGRTDAAHAHALEKLGAEISRISERLAERIGHAERRSAQAIDDVGETVARVTDKLNQRHERFSEDLVERIRQSEERTARLLDEAREKIDQRLAETQRRLAEPPPALGAGFPHAAAHAPFGPSAYLGPAEPDPRESEAIAPEPTTAGFPAAATPTEAERPPLAEEDFEAASGFAEDRDLQPTPDMDEVEVEGTGGPSAFTAAGAAAEPDYDADDDWVRAPMEPREPARAAPAADVDEPQAQAGSPYGRLPTARDIEEVPYDDEDEFVAPAAAAEAAQEPARPLTTREVIEQARAAAKAAAQSGEPKARRNRLRAERPAAAAGKLFSGFTISRPKRRAPSTLQTALLVAGGAAFLGVGAAGLVVMEGKPSGAPPKRVADALQNANAPGLEASASPFGDSPRAAVAVAPQMIGPGAPPPSAESAPDLAGLYSEAVHSLEAKQPGALDGLRKVANLGYAPAQLYLAKLYEKGDGGVKKDLAEARRWTERAAQNGDRKAMHNLALYYFEGTGGGAKNSTTAAQWFRRAADLGLVDSQYNLGRLYEEGIGVSQNAAEAYKWYLVAARAGDAESRASAQRVKAQLSPAAQSIAERAAVAFRASGQAPAPSMTADAAPAQLQVAQRALSRLGYYQGPTDGSASPALRLAVAAYQRDQGMAPTGVLDSTTVSKLSIFTR